MLLGPVMLDIAGTQLTASDKRRLQHPLTGGVILFTRNYSSYTQLIKLTTEIHALRNPPLFIAIDHEGGRVQRFRKDFTPLPAMRELGRIWDTHPDHARDLAWQIGYVIATELNACGIDFSFTPVLDADHGQSGVIGDRAFHHNPYVITELAHNLMSGLESAGMIAIGKHFPGHGYIQADSHAEESVDNRTYADIEAGDLIPFRQMIDFGLAGIMSAHIIYPKVDKYPAGFSRIWLEDILRRKLRFDGCIFSDDLSMQGAAYFDTIDRRAQASLNAGCDMVLACNDSQAADQLLAKLQWNASTSSIMRLNHIHERRRFNSMNKLRENTDYIEAVKKISRIECK
ncbi:beta-N-acetylhexosaminidase [Nitrosomonas cryotolerans]|uniref:beta-N-acetylhexosaminidase n=1 Tax=Nitrosomonas cryotolerans TaxID=44575 RepID=UPI00048FC75B|nr:beta-N-acetylhexosaminidase [Nitrosomonas cryotolerans]SFP36988.1 beta-N-acetylhexosaminidase [Nitrosomonas cryotolerans]